jgi:hypothetical protein
MIPIKVDRPPCDAQAWAMVATDALVEAFRIQARVCAAMGSPFSAGLLERAAADGGAGGPVAQILSPWAEATREVLMKDAAPLRLLGAAHDLALSGEDAALQAAWPSPDRAGDLEGAWAALAGAMRAGPRRFADFVTHEPQTNEARRSVCLLGGFLEAARATGLPLRTWELGASAGLNQLWDLYRYDLGAAGAWGDPAAPVRLDTDWRGPPPPLGAPVRVVARAACDRAPIDLADPIAARRLRAYVWADQFDRLARLDAAVALARAHGVRVEAADALAFVRDRVTLERGSLAVVYHSIFWQYLPAQTQAALEQAIAELGARATNDAPMAWLRMEPQAANLAQIEVRLTLWPLAPDRRLALCDPHGRWLEWEGAAAG